MRRRPRPRVAATPSSRFAGLAAWPLALRAQARPALEPTPRDAEGPFYPTRIPADADSDLAQVKGRPQPAQGVLLYLTGRVLGVDGTPLAGARVELWQCDALGRYHHVEGDPGPRDENFQGYGVAVTDGQGRVCLPDDPPGSLRRHARRTCTSRSRIPERRRSPRSCIRAAESAERSAGFGLSDRGTRSRLEFVLAPAAGKEPSALAATYDFVLAVPAAREPAQPAAVSAR